MSEETVSQSTVNDPEKFDPAPTADIDAEWRNELPFEFRPVAERHGKDLFIIAYNIGSVNEGLKVLIRRCRGNRELENALQFVGNGLNVLTTILMLDRDIKPEKIKEVQTDIERAAQLASVAGRTPGSSIILPGH